MTLLRIAANPLVPTRLAVIGLAERDAACPVSQRCWARLSADQPPQHRDDTAFADEQQEHDCRQHDLDAPAPFAGLLPSLGADRFVHGELRRHLALAHGVVYPLQPLDDSRDPRQTELLSQAPL